MSDIIKLKELLKEALDKRNKNLEAEVRAKLMQTVGADLVSSLSPLLKELAGGKASMIEDLKQAIREIKVEVPEVKVPPIEVPETYIPPFPDFPKIPQPVVNYTPPAINIPDIKMPDEMDIRGWISIMGYDKGLLANPLPVQLRDAQGRPLDIFENLRQVMGGGAKGAMVPSGWSGGKADFLTIKGFSQSAFSEIQNPDGRVKVELPSGSSGLTDTELRAAHLDTQQLSGSVDSVNVVQSITLETTQLSGAIHSSNIQQIGGNPVVVGAGYQDNALRVVQATDSISSVNIIGTVPVSATDLDIRDLNVGQDEILMHQVSGSKWSTEATQAGTWNVGITGALSSAVVVGPTAADAADDGNPPIQIGGVARQANPTAVAANDIVKSTHDDLGRQVMRLHQVRDLIQTAYVSIANGTETTLRAAVAGAYLDLIYIMGSNNSDAAVTVDIRAVTAGGVMMTLQIPANGVAGVSLPIPIPQQETGNNWTADLPDITGTTVYLSALFSQEI